MYGVSYTLLMKIDEEVVCLRNFLYTILDFCSDSMENLIETCSRCIALVTFMCV